ncbi:unnamed protein product [Owenia fusiformis]|uniref:C2H2-type domain-containing protein n=1 Tax=Owenia fusiformis TaxID=6347 RepID=A0A8S4NA49_OWEFU|nr:unnamed protein product [Owenia fusiformis]
MLSSLLQGRKHFNCNICDKSYTDSSSLNRHKRRVHATSPRARERYQCELCLKYLANKTILAIHQRIHTGEKYKCGMCSKEYSDPGSLRRHKRQAKHNIVVKNEEQF